MPDILYKIKDMVENLYIFANKKENGNTRYTLISHTSKQDCLRVLYNIQELVKDIGRYDFYKHREDVIKYSVKLENAGKIVSFDLENKDYNIEEVKGLLNSIFYSIDVQFLSDKGD